MKTDANSMPSLSIGNLVASIPVIQGGMGIGVSLSSLAAAVANAGGIGVLSAAGLGFDSPGYKNNPVEVCINALRDEIRKTKKLTNGIIGINIMVALTNFADMVKASIEEGIDIIFAGAGLPLDLPRYVEGGAATKLVPIISSEKAAAVLLKRWISKYNYLPDGFVVEGPLAGGHLGFKKEQIPDGDFALENLVSKVIEAVAPYEEKHRKQIPVIAAGGVYSGEDIHRFLSLGAAGVQMGTRFAATHECDASAEFKNAFVNCREEDITLINSPVGLPGRAIKNEFIEASEQGKKHPFRCPYHCLKTCDYKQTPYCISLALINAKKGNLKGGFVFAGQNAYRIDKIISVNELMESLKQEYEACS